MVAAILSGSDCLTLNQASPDKAEKARPGPVLLACPGEQAEGKRRACQPEALRWVEIFSYSG